MKENDNELLYLISDNNEDAYLILCKKYQPLILSKIKDKILTKNEKEEHYSESLICFDKAVKTYSDLYNVSFNRYFNLLLDRKFIDLNRKKIKEDKISYLNYLEDLVLEPALIDNKLIEEDFKLSRFEQEIYELKFCRSLKPCEIAYELKCNVRQIYDAIERIRKKARKK